MKTIYKGSDGSLGFKQQREYKLNIKVERDSISVVTRSEMYDQQQLHCKYSSFTAFTTNWTIECESLQEEVELEQMRQISKFGERNQHALAWSSILQEEVGEVAREINDNDFEWFPGDKYRKELIEVAAVALSAVQNYDRRKQYEEEVEYLARDRREKLASFLGKVEEEDDRLTRDRIISLGFTQDMMLTNRYKKGRFTLDFGPVSVLYDTNHKGVVIEGFKKLKHIAAEIDSITYNG